MKCKTIQTVRIIRVTNNRFVLYFFLCKNNFWYSLLYINNIIVSMQNTIRSASKFYTAVQPKFKWLRNIMTSTPKFEKIMDNLKSNPYYEKYAQRIAALQESNPEVVEQRLETLKPTSSDVDTRQYSGVLNPKQPIKSGINVEDKKLDNILKLDLLKDKEPLEIQRIWEEYHKNKDVISATIDVATYSGIHSNAKKYSTFLFPLPRCHGYEFIVCQNYGHSAHFTPLLAFQVHKENAPECLTVVHYTELSHDKGLVLMRGDYDKNVVDGREAQCLANQFQMYYGGRDAHRLRLLHAFNADPRAFKHMDLISQLENIQL